MCVVCGVCHCFSSISSISSLCLVLSELCNISIDNLQSGSISPSKYAKAAESLKVEIGSLMLSIQSLSHILLECARRNCTSEELVNSLPDELAFTSEQKTILQQSFTQHFRDLRLLLSDLSLRLPHYHNLEWRLDIQLSSKMLRNQVEPLLLVELETKDAEDQSQRQMLQLDYTNLDHLVKELEQAVKEINNKHSRRVLRYVK